MFVHKNAIKTKRGVKLSDFWVQKLVFSPFFWAFGLVFFVIFGPKVRDFYDKSSGNTDSSRRVVDNRHIVWMYGFVDILIFEKYL